MSILSEMFMSKQRDDESLERNHEDESFSFQMLTEMNKTGFINDELAEVLGLNTQEIN